MDYKISSNPIRLFLMSTIYTVLITLFSCQNTPTKIYKDYYSNLALVENSYYYALTAFDDSKMYAVIENDNFKAFDNLKDAIDNVSSIVGIGFFLSNNGKLVTHKNLIEPHSEIPKIEAEAIKMINNSTLNYRQEISGLIDELEMLSDYYERYGSFVTEMRREELIKEYNEKYRIAKLIGRELDNLKKLKEEGYNIQLINHAIKVSEINENKFNSYSKEFIPITDLNINGESTSMFFLKPKSYSRYNSVKEINLNQGMDETIIKNDLVHVFSLEMESIKKPEYIPVFAKDIGIMGITDISLEFKDEKTDFVLGSPILNTKGILIGLSDSPATNSSQKAIRIKSLDISVRNKESILKFLKAEDERNLKRIESLFASNIEDYYGMSSPSFDDLTKAYENIWNFTRNSKNDVLRIQEIDAYNYILTTNFSYYNTKSQQDLNTESKIKFTFNSEGKIIKINKI